MSDAVPRHPEAQTMAAFVDGTLAPFEVTAVAEHLRGCDECRVVVSETARFAADERPESRRTWWMSVAAVLAVLLVAATVLVQVSRSQDPIRRLIAAAPHEHRNVEARLSGFPWARLQAPSRGGPKLDPADLKLAGAAGEVLDAKDTHAIGVAYLLIDRRPESLDALEGAADSSTDAAVWNDLAAARLATAVRDDHPAQLPPALAAADHALRLDPKFAPALFNRALILEHLGLRDAARMAWQKYLDADPSSDWSGEARLHLARLNQRGEMFDEKALRTATGAQLVAFVRRFPQESRTYAEGPFLIEWSHSRSDEILGRSRAIGVALCELHGECLLGDSVTAIDRADEGTRNQLAEAYRVYGDARRAYSTHQVGAAEPEFRRAASSFHDCGSAMALVAAYYAAQCSLDQHRGGDELRRLRASIDTHRYPALTGEIEWELALAANVAADSGAAIRHADAASEMFLTLGERANAANADGLAAVALSIAGDADRAWKHYVRSFEALPAPRRESLVQVAGSVLDWCDETDAAAALIRVWAENSRESSAYARATAFAREARLDPRNATASLATARAALRQVLDPTQRSAAKAEVDLADDVVNSPNAPHAFDGAVGFIGQHGMKNLLPDALLQRARAYRAAGDEGSALNDCVAALAAADERSRDVRTKTIATEIVEETIDIHLKRGDAAAAFAVADRSHSIPGALPAGTTLIEYTALPQSLVVFSCTQGDLRAERVSVPRRRIAALERRLVEKMVRLAPESDVRAAAAPLYALLIAPVEGRIANADELIVIPDRHTALPFPALYDGRSGHYLVEQFTIHVASSAKAPEIAAASAITPALVVGDPPAISEARLAAGRAEAQQVAALYGATLLTGANATRDRFVALAKTSALIHYAGHAVNGALLLASSESDTGFLEATDVAHLALPRHPLVVLAACSTFSDLSRAFLDAGARGVVGTLWDIDDDVSAPLFLSFHEQLRAATPPARALREAQLAMLHSSDPVRRHPASWGGVEIITNSAI
jgi:CHAT domain-containing protein